ncbi:MAG: c-type cytochrome [Pirellulaceae bacterium]
MKTAPTQEDQMRYAFSLREHEATWDEASREAYFGWFRDAAAARGGMSFGGFLENIRNAAVAKLSDAQKTKLGDLLKTPEVRDPLADLAPRQVVKEWTVDDSLKAIESMSGPYDFERGKQMFAVGQCYKCHRMNTQGGILGPDLTGAGGRFSNKDLLASIIEPNKVISDQYGATQFLTFSGQVIVGKVVNMNGKNLMVLTNMMEPANQTVIDRDDIDMMETAKISMMPGGLINTMSAEEIRDLLGYLKAGGNPSHSIYHE